MRYSALLLVFCAGCVSVGRGRLMENRIQRLEEQNDQVSKQIEEQRAVVRDRVAKVDDKIAQVQKKIDELNAAAHRTGADLAVNQDKLQDQFTKFKGQLEEEQHRLELLESSLAGLKSDTEARFAAIKGAGALEEYEAKKQAESMKLPPDKAAFFDAAQKQEAAGDKALARELYQQFVQKWPSDPRAADAHFRIGEILFGDKRYREAILAYGKTARDFPRSDKAPDALYRIGESMVQLDLKDGAKDIFTELLERYPKSSAASKAKSRVAELSKGGKKTKGGR